MTDKEIIRALRVCSRRTDAQTCAECPLFDSEDCMGDMMVGAADLIERQIVVSAPDEDTAIQRAKERFRYCCRNNAVYTECDSIEVDLVEMEGKA